MTQAQLVADLGSDVVFSRAPVLAFLVVYLALARGWRTEIGGRLSPWTQA